MYVGHHKVRYGVSILNYRNKTSTGRWRQSGAYNEKWAERGTSLMQLFIDTEYEAGRQYTISEFGCGAFAPLHTHYNGKDGFQVQKFDIHKWDDETELLDFNMADATIPAADISIFSGVLEYLNDVSSVISSVLEKSDYVLLSYAFLPASVHTNEKKYIAEISQRASSNGWRNHYSSKDIVDMIAPLGVVSAASQWRGQSLFVLRNFNVDKR